MGLIFGTHPLTRFEFAALNAGIAAAFLFALTRAPLHAEWRDFLPYPLGLLCYREAGWIATVTHFHDLEHKWIVWDRLVLDTWHARATIEFFGPVIPSLLEAAYLSVYIIGPVGIGVLYFYRRQDQADSVWLAFLTGLMLSYIQFPFWPSEPPRTVFAGLDLPTFTTALRRLNLFLVGSYGIHSSVFPSAHVSGAVAGALMLRRVMHDRPWVGNMFLTVAGMIAVATVYGRYHYVVDALAGTLVGILAYRLVRQACGEIVS